MAERMSEYCNLSLNSVLSLTFHVSLLRYLSEHFGLHFQGHTLDNSVHTNCDLRCDLACVTLSLSVIASYNTNFGMLHLFAYTHDAHKLDFLDSN